MSFNEKEVENAKVRIMMLGDKPYELVSFDTPISIRENVRRTYAGNPLWVSSKGDESWFVPSIIPDNPARAFVGDAVPYEGPFGGKDMFGIDWEYVEAARGSIVRPGNPVLTDISKWREVIHFPDVDSWDWQGNAELNRGMLEGSALYMNFCVFTGWFERLISFMDFGPAAFAMMNKAQKPYVHEIFDALSDLWIDIVDHACKYYGRGIDGFAFHDDWGAQHSPFFNAKIVEEMLVPYMKRVTDHIHALGYTAELHSCGKIEKLIPCVINAGWDSWEGMAINDYRSLYEQYGDKLLMAVSPTVPEDGASDEENIAWADAFAGEYIQKGKPIFRGFNSCPKAVYTKELYKQSRLIYDKD